MSKKGVLRGLHFQKTYQQGKLVSVIIGEDFKVFYEYGIKTGMDLFFTEKAKHYWNEKQKLIEAFTK